MGEKKDRVERFDQPPGDHVGMSRHDEGDWVMYEDFDALQRENVELRGEVERFRSAVECDDHVAEVERVHYLNAELRAEVEKLRWYKQLDDATPSNHLRVCAQRDRLVELVEDFEARTVCMDEAAGKPACGKCFHCHTRALLREIEREGWTDS